MDELPLFAKHTSRLLRQQLLNELVAQYLLDRFQASGLEEASAEVAAALAAGKSPTAEAHPELLSEIGCRPSLQRFHGALLFVDISGFTPLAQKLDVEELKHQINGYFTKILEIVDKWGGDVVKFAGDALYVVWPTDIHRGGKQTIATGDGKNSSPMKDVASVRSVGVGTGLASNARFLAAAKQALEKAVACGLEISVTCGKYEVRLDKNAPTDTHQSSGLLGRFLPNFSLSSFMSPTAKIAPMLVGDAVDSETVVYLDVHAGVSLGLMGGVDIGSQDRWEYFVIGDPVDRVAECEGDAEKGDVVMCKKSHNLLHSRNRTSSGEDVNSGYSNIHRRQSKDENNVSIRSRRWSQRQSINLHVGNSKSTDPLEEEQNAKGELACGCFVTKSGLYCVSKVDTQIVSPTKPSIRRSRSRFKLEGSHREGELNAQNAKILEEINTDLDTVFFKTEALFRKGYNASLLSLKRHQKATETQTVGFAASGREDNSEDNPDAATDSEKGFNSFYFNQLRPHFTQWMKQHLLDDVVRHVHEAARDEYVFQGTNRLGAFHDIVRTASVNNTRLALDAVTTGLRAVSEGTVSDSSPLADAESVTSFHRPPPRSNSSFDLDNRPDLSLHHKPAPSLSKSGSKLSVRNLSVEAQSTAELRTVSVMFVKIDTFDLKLMVDSFRSKSKTMFNALCYESFFFLDRTDNEIAADQVLLDKFQRCIEVLCAAFKDNGGQLRQFIVDDKGTVCIGTFGLRGAVNNDNSAASLNAARRIITSLQNQNLSASIGITSGKAYCGLVGSVFRHEYAVMGPSTNLSARLMGKARPLSVLCDTETKTRDRTHGFVALDAVNAKGYSEPVMTYRPLYEESTIHPHGSRSFVGLSDGSSGLVLGTMQEGEPHPDMGLRPADHAIMALLSPQEKIIRLADSDFYITSNQAVHMMQQQQQQQQQQQPSSNDSSAGDTRESGDLIKLLGRQSELSFIFHTLFIPASEGQYTSVFSTKSHTRLIAISGPSGVGKTSLVTSIGRKLSTVAKHDPTYNIFVLHRHQSAIHTNIPLHIWKPFVIEILRQFYFASVNPSSTGELGQTLPPSVHTDGRSSQRAEVTSGFDFALSKLPTYQPVRALLLTVLGLISDREFAETRSLLSDKEKLNHCMNFVVSLFSIAADVLKKYILICIESVELLDKWSLVVLHKIWVSSSGVGVLVTYCPHDESALKSWSLDVYDNAPPIRSNPQQTHFFFRRYDDPERFRSVDLRPLGKRSISLLAEEYFGMKISDNADLDQLYDASGGHPLYAVELMKSLISNVCDTNNNNTAKSKAQLAKMQTSMSSTHHRIEEIICFRLDKLDFSVQIVLKAAAVAASHGRRFTASLIQFILVDNDIFAGVSPPLTPTGSQGDRDRDLVVSKRGSFDEIDTPIPQPSDSINVADVLALLLEKDDFIRLGGSSNNGKASADLLSTGVELEFQIPLEQATIYSIVIDDQKFYFHERIALYIHMQVVRDSEQDTLENNDNEGFHWEKACLWSRALRSYMSCAIKERKNRNLVGWSDYIKLSYRMYKCMEQETKQLHPLEEWSESTIEFILNTFLGADRKTALGDVSSRESGRSSSRFRIHKEAQEVVEQESYRSLKEDFLSVIEVFDIDNNVLPLVANLHMHLADLYMQQFEDLDLVLFVLGVAIKLFLVAIIGKEKIVQYYSTHITHCNTQMSKPNFPATLQEEASDPSINSGRSPTIKSPRPTSRRVIPVNTYSSEMEFGVFHQPVVNITNLKRIVSRDYSFRKASLGERDCMHLLSTFSVVSYFAPGVSSQYQLLIANIAERCYNFATEVSSPNDVDLLQSLCLQCLQYLHCYRHDKAIVSATLLLDKFNSRVHSIELEDVFGVNAVVYIFSTMAQRLLLLGRWPEGQQFAVKCIEILKSIVASGIDDYHPSSLVIAIIPLLSTLVATQQGHAAWELWNTLSLSHVQMNRLEIALKPLVSSLGPWLDLHAASSAAAAFDFKSYFVPNSAVDKSDAVVNAGQVAALPKSLTSTQPAPKPISMARAMSTIFSEDLLPSQLRDMLVLGGCSLECVHAEVAIFQLVSDAQQGQTGDGSRRFLCEFEELVSMSLNDSPGNASTVCALNMSTPLAMIMRQKEVNPSLPLESCFQEMTQYFLTDLPIVLQNWRSNGLWYPIQIVSKFALDHLDLTSSIAVQRDFQALLSESLMALEKSAAHAVNEGE